MGANLKSAWVIDVECTCWKTDAEQGTQKQEIIEIGVARLDMKTNVIERFACMTVKPLFSTVSLFCEELTGWTQEDVMMAPPFTEICDGFLQQNFFKSGDVWFSCGEFDRRVLVDEPKKLYGLSPVLNPFARMRSHFNVKTLFALRHRLKKEVGVSKMLGMIGQEFEGQPHNGADDAYNIAKIVRHILT